MFVKFYGTRGSIAVSGRSSLHYGGNTTCVRIQSPSLPPNMWLVVDAGTGIVPLSWDFAEQGGQAVAVLLTHFHHDHTQGMLLTHFPYTKTIPVYLLGPHQNEVGPWEVYQTLMQPPYFPVHFNELASHLHPFNIDSANDTVLLIHPRGGLHLMSVEELDRSVNADGQARCETGSFSIDECMVVRMYRSNHPEQTISYRFEDRPSGSVFVFMTDHENQDGMPARMREHLLGADLLVMDCQYTREKYDKFTTGYGHATPDYVARVARETEVPRLGLTHHDPPASDAQIDDIVRTVQHLLPGVEVFGCYDYIEIEVDRGAVSLGGA